MSKKIKIISLNPICCSFNLENCIKAFAKLGEEKPKSFFCSLSNYGKIALNYYTNKKLSKLIDTYKLGNKQREDFLEELQEILESILGKIREEDLDLIAETELNYSTNSIHNFLAHAWNLGVHVSDENFVNMANLINSATEDAPVHLTTGTNELNMIQILELWKQKAKKNSSLFTQTLDFSAIDLNSNPIKLAEHVYLHTSYAKKSFRLIQEIINDVHYVSQADKSDVKVVTYLNHWKPDCCNAFINELKNLDIQRKNILEPSDYLNYSNTSSLDKKIR